jgi:glycosyltransferase involved in cell wall biosynthesis
MLEPLVSVVVITYNHEEFIGQAIESILMQECDFEFELIIADDCSPDNTKVIIENFRNHPKFNCIKYFRHDFNKGVIRNFVWALEQCIGIYTAICEGDDYWIDPLKLSKQVAQLKNNLTCSAVVSNGYIVKNGSILKDFNAYLKTGEISTDLIFSNWLFPTASIMFRRKKIR